MTSRTYLLRGREHPADGMSSAVQTFITADSSERARAKALKWIKERMPPFPIDKELSFDLYAGNMYLGTTLLNKRPLGIIHRKKYSEEFTYTPINNGNIINRYVLNKDGSFGKATKLR